MTKPEHGKIVIESSARKCLLPTQHSQVGRKSSAVALGGVATVRVHQALFEYGYNLQQEMNRTSRQSPIDSDGDVR